jgi:hypothetical protein
MKLVTTKNHINSAILEFAEKAKELNLLYSASATAKEMKIKNVDEFQRAVSSAMNHCSKAGIPMEGNFKRIFISTRNGIVHDWKLSPVAYMNLKTCILKLKS